MKRCSLKIRIFTKKSVILISNKHAYLRFRLLRRLISHKDAKSRLMQSSTHLRCYKTIFSGFIEDLYKTIVISKKRDTECRGKCASGRTNKKSPAESVGVYHCSQSGFRAKTEQKGLSDNRVYLYPQARSCQPPSAVRASHHSHSVYSVSGSQAVSSSG